MITSAASSSNVETVKCAVSGDIVGDFRIDKLIGKGAFSRVFKGYHVITNKSVAIKVIDKKNMKDKVERSCRRKEKLRAERLEAATKATACSTSAGNNTNNLAVETEFTKAARQAAALAAERVISPISTPPPDPETIKSLFDLLYAEVKLMMRLNHPNIVSLYQVVDTAIECYIIMEFAEGGELIDHITQLGKLNEDEARTYFRQILSAVGHCHACGVVHRDLKLENLLLSRGNEIRVTDFGLGRTFEIADDHEPEIYRMYHERSLMDTFCGTPNYAAVELVQFRPYAGVKTDIWALGVILYIMVTGHPPFASSSISQLYTRIKSLDYTCPEYFSKPLCSLFERIFVSDPDSRITIDEMCEHAWVSPPHLGAVRRVPPFFASRMQTHPSEVNRLIGAEQIISVRRTESTVTFTFAKYTCDCYRPPPVATRFQPGFVPNAQHQQRRSGVPQTRISPWREQPVINSLLGTPFAAGAPPGYTSAACAATRLPTSSAAAAAAAAATVNLQEVAEKQSAKGPSDGFSAQIAPMVEPRLMFHVPQPEIITVRSPLPQRGGSSNFLAPQALPIQNRVVQRRGVTRPRRVSQRQLTRTQKLQGYEQELEDTEKKSSINDHVAKQIVQQSQGLGQTQGQESRGAVRQRYYGLPLIRGSRFSVGNQTLTGRSAHTTFMDLLYALFRTRNNIKASYTLEFRRNAAGRYMFHCALWSHDISEHAEEDQQLQQRLQKEEPVSCDSSSVCANEPDLRRDLGMIVEAVQGSRMPESQKRATVTEMRDHQEALMRHLRTPLSPTKSMLTSGTVDFEAEVCHAWATRMHGVRFKCTRGSPMLLAGVQRLITHYLYAHQQRSNGSFESSNAEHQNHHLLLQQ